jgi:hypothetical protein
MRLVILDTFSLKIRMRFDLNLAEKLFFRQSEQGCQMGCFQTKIRNLGKFLEGLSMEKVGIFYAHREYITAVWYTYFMDIW